MSKKGDPTTTQTTSMDPATLAYINKYRDAANTNVASANRLNQPEQDALGRYNQAAGGLDFASQTGLGGLDQYMNPFQNDVISGVHSDFDRQRSMADNQAADMATKSNAFGGDREAVLRAENARNINQSEASTLAGVRSSGFNNAVGQLFQDRGMQAGLGMAGTQGLFGAGQQMDANKQAALQAMTQGFVPGSTTSNTQTHTPSNPWGTILGLAGTVFGGPLGGMLGGALGGGLGGLGGQQGISPSVLK